MSRFPQGVLCLLAFTLLISTTTQLLAAVGDGVNMSLLGRWPYGRVSDVVLDGDVAYIADGGILRVVDISDLDAPSVIGEIDVLMSIMDIDLEGDHVHAACWLDGLVVIDVSVASDPTGVGQLNLSGRAQNVDAIAGTGQVLVSRDSAGMSIIDVSDPTNPTHLGQIDIGEYCTSVAGIGTTAYVGTVDGLYILDISTPGTPTTIGLCEHVIVPNRLTLAGDLVYATVNYNGYAIVDVSTPATPDTLCTGDLGDRCRNIFVSGNRAYLANGQLGTIVLDVTDPTAPVELGRIDDSGDHHSVVVSGNTACVAADASGLQIHDFSDLGTPIPRGAIAGHDLVIAISLAEDLAFLSCGYGGLVVLDISNLAAPVEIGTFQTDINYCLHAIEADSYLYLIDSNDFLVLDASDPAAMVEVGSYSLSTYGRRLTLAGNLAYVGCQVGMQIVDISTPITPVARGFYDIPHECRQVIVEGSYAYLTADSDGLHIIDISDPDSPIVVGTFATSSSAQYLAKIGSHVYVSLGGYGFQIVDVSAPTAPVLAGNSSQPAFEMVIQGSYAHLAGYGSGVFGFDLTEPTAPVQEASFDVSQKTEFLIARGSTVFAQDQFNGLWIIDDEVITPSFLAAFTVERIGATAQLSWRTTGSLPGGSFQVWRQQSHNRREPIGRLPAGDQATHHFVDEDAPRGATEYWLQITQSDGSQYWFGPTSTSAAAAIPATVFLDRNWPNPFKPATSFTYRVPKGGRARITIHDARGRLVATLVDGVVPAGENLVEWNGCDDTGRQLASGTYFARLQIEGGVSTRKMLLAR